MQTKVIMSLLKSSNTLEVLTLGIIRHKMIFRLNCSLCQPFNLSSINEVLLKKKKCE